MKIAGRISALYVDKAYTARVAISKVKEAFWDLIVLDLYKEGVLAGYEVLP